MCQFERQHIIRQIVRTAYSCSFDRIIIRQRFIQRYLDLKFSSCINRRNSYCLCDSQRRGFPCIFIYDFCRSALVLFNLCRRSKSASQCIVLNLCFSIDICSNFGNRIISCGNIRQRKCLGGSDFELPCFRICFCQSKSACQPESFIILNRYFVGELAGSVPKQFFCNDQIAGITCVNIFNTRVWCGISFYCKCHWCSLRCAGLACINRIRPVCQDISIRFIIDIFTGFHERKLIRCKSISIRRPCFRFIIRQLVCICLLVSIVSLFRSFDNEAYFFQIVINILYRPGNTLLRQNLTINRCVGYCKLFILAAYSYIFRGIFRCPSFRNSFNNRDLNLVSVCIPSGDTCKCISPFSICIFCQCYCSCRIIRLPIRLQFNWKVLRFLICKDFSIPGLFNRDIDIFLPYSIHVLNGICFISSYMLDFDPGPGSVFSPVFPVFPFQVKIVLIQIALQIARIIWIRSASSLRYT